MNDWTHKLPPIGQLGPFIALLIACAFFATQSPNFLTGGNLSLILQQVMVVGVIAIGQTLIILTAGIDLSCGMIMALGSIVMTKMGADFGLSAPVAITLGITLLATMLMIWFERKIISDLQNRIGPNRAGPQGFIVWIADGIKSITKEDIIPTDSDNVLFRLAPYLVFMGVSATFVVMPFGQYLIAADLDLNTSNIGLVGLIDSGVAFTG